MVPRWEESCLKLGPLTVHACHAAIEPEFARRDIETLIQRCRAETEGEPAMLRATRS